MDRRAFIAESMCLLVAPLAAEAQQAGKVWRVGYLAGSPRVPQIDAFIQGLRDLGYVEGRNVEIELKLAYGKLERLPDLAAELVRSGPDVIVAASTIGGMTIKKATSTIPIVVVASHDGVKLGLYESLARPGANVTGIESLAPGLDAKRLEFLKEAVPGLSRLSVIYNPGYPGGPDHVEIIKSAAQAVGAEVRLIEMRSAGDLDAALAAILRDRPDAVLTVADPLVFAHRERIAQFTLQNRLPGIHEWKAFADFGGLMSYGPNMPELWRRAAHYADKILKGAKPADLPVEQPTKFELVVNLRAAKEIGVAIPQSLLLRANEVIE
jgi:putative ABC transport system substrate-binding protein